ncbi:MAG: hypothetical protein RLZZ232_385 [Planctomycetota bacterium]
MPGTTLPGAMFGIRKRRPEKNILRPNEERSGCRNCLEFLPWPKNKASEGTASDYYTPLETIAGDPDCKGFDRFHDRRQGV